jgi:hypothetical protein
MAVSIGDVNPLDNIVATLYGALTDDANVVMFKLVPTSNLRVWNLVMAAASINFEANNQLLVGVRVSIFRPACCLAVSLHWFIRPAMRLVCWSRLWTTVALPSRLRVHTL